MESYKRLALEVVKSGVQDLKIVNGRIKRYTAKLEQGEEGYLIKLVKAKRAKDLIIEFFESEWCEFWCDIAGVGYGAVMDRVRGLASDGISKQVI